MMVAEILVGLEESPGGQRALAVALDVGRALSATLVGLPIDDGSGAGATFLARSAETGVAAHTLAPEGALREMVRREILRHDLTVLGREASLRFGPQAADSPDGPDGEEEGPPPAAEKPILVVPERDLPTGPSVLIAYDGSAASKRALTAFGESGLDRGRAVHVAAVGDDAAAAWETAVDGCELLYELGVAAAPHNLATPHTVSRALLEERARLNAGLLVLGGYTRSHVARLLWGSVTQEMLDKTEVPLFLHY
jgi:nucleotide-binding universal stress UspA family protein